MISQGNKNKRKNVSMFDVRLDPDEAFDVAPAQEEEEIDDVMVYQLGEKYSTHEVPHYFKVEMAESEKPASAALQSKNNFRPAEIRVKDIQKRKQVKYSQPTSIRLNFFNKLSEKLEDFSISFSWQRYKYSFAAIALILITIFGYNSVQKGLEIKGTVLGESQIAYANLKEAKESMLGRNFQGAQVNFQKAYASFDKMSKEFEGMGSFLIGFGKYIPYVSKISSGAALAQAGKDISEIGILSGQMIATFDGVKNPLQGGSDSVSLLQIFRETSGKAENIRTLFADAQENLDKVDVDDLPEDKRVQFVELKSKMPEIKDGLDVFLANGEIFSDILGGNGPRKYLFLFQNNHEMRATGGFIGSYGVLDIFDGRVRKFFIDGIFNPDGQFQARIVPPFPIQKISANWSLHDSNWFPDFPTSAEKATLFYEKTGGPTVDGVITMTPVVMQKLLAITGPIEMPDYGITIDENNFVEKVQQEVEIDYDKELNQPKKILSDLAPLILDKIFNARNFSDIKKIAKVLGESLREKQILIYSKNYEIEKKISAFGWSGEILDTPKDYLAVINSNINGFKTDGVIDEKIEHRAEIQSDGSVIDTVTITRHHNGGNTDYEWWNKVNADYMRVYVPKGSELLSVEGQTREFDPAPVDYDALGFKRDPQVRMEEENMVIDEESGTRISEDAGKTVFGNWTYVSPQETLVVTYKYKLPFKVSLEGNLVSTYSLLAQKQSGSVGSQLVSEISFPEKYKLNWKSPEDISVETNKLKLETDLKTDKFIGVAFTRN